MYCVAEFTSRKLSTCVSLEETGGIATFIKPPRPQDTRRMPSGVFPKTIRLLVVIWSLSLPPVGSIPPRKQLVTTATVTAHILCGQDAYRNSVTDGLQRGDALPLGHPLVINRNTPWITVPTSVMIKGRYLKANGFPLR